MYLHWKNKAITGILSIVPSNEVHFDDEVENYAFSASQTMQLKKVMGYDKHRICKSEACISDLICYGFNHLFDQNLIQKDEIDAMILLTNSPDYPVPPTSNIIQGMLDMKTDMICLDINQGCAGYMVGLMQAFMLLDQEAIRKVAIVTSDIESRTHSYKDRSSYPLMGDAATISIVENKPSKAFSQYIKMDGKGALSICMPAGGLKCPASEDSIKMKDDGSGNILSGHHIHMVGDQIFNFVMGTVPQMFKDIFEKEGLTYDDVDYFMLHQPNKFILSRLAKKIGVDKNKVPANVVETLGNSASSTIPNVITLNLADSLTTRSFKLCLGAFGEGLIWSASIMDIGPLDFCQMIEMDI